MIFSNYRKTMQTALTALLIAGAATGLSSCDSLIYDDQGDCTVHYQVPFTYTMNILDADAFASQVTGVTLYVFDKSGNLVLTKSDSGPGLSKPGYKMDVELLPGNYDMLAWCTGTSPMSDHTAFAIGQGSHPADFTATLPLLGTAPALYNDLDITPLFHGTAYDVECIKDDYGYIDLPAINLTKDTNVIKVILNNVDGREMSASDFTIAIEADNSEMDYLNNLTGSRGFRYLPWSSVPVSTAGGESARAGEGQTVTGLFSELTVGRLVTSRRPMISVTRNADSEELFRFPLIDFLLMVKGHYQGNFSDQEYLDRMDDYSLTFFLDDNLNWYTAGGVLINGWKVVPPQIEDL